MIKEEKSEVTVITPVFQQIPVGERLGPYATLKGAAEALGISEIRLQRILKKMGAEPRKFGWVHALHRDTVEGIWILLSTEPEPPSN